MADFPDLASLLCFVLPSLGPSFIPSNTGLTARALGPKTTAPRPASTARRSSMAAAAPPVPAASARMEAATMGSRGTAYECSKRRHVGKRSAAKQSDWRCESAHGATEQIHGEGEHYV